MPNLDESLSLFRDTISNLVKSQKSILVTTHIDCDGITSGSIITKALVRAGANVTVRTSPEFTKNTVDTMAGDERDFHIVTDLGSGFANELDTALGENWLVLDHHEIPSEDMENPRVINAWKYGIDGGSEICAGGMSFLAAHALDDSNVDLSAIAVVSALGDRQDKGEKKSFLGKNADIADTAQKHGLVDINLDILLTGRETRPLVDSLAFTSQPYMDGLTWNRSACSALLSSSKIPLKQGGRWRVAAELDDDEKRTLMESVTRYVSGPDATKVMSQLVGYAYTFPREDAQSFLKDCREFSTMLNSCGRINKAGVGIAVCLGDRDELLRQSESILSEYKKNIREYMNILAGERWRVSSPSEHVLLINGDGLIPESMTGTIASLVAGSPKNMGKIIVLYTPSADKHVKFSSRKSPDCTLDVNLSKVMRDGARLVGSGGGDGHGNGGSVGGGHDSAAGAKIEKDKLVPFLDYLESCW